MEKEQNSRIDINLKRYCERKNKLKEALVCRNKQATKGERLQIRRTERELDEAFANLLYSTPKNLSETLIKSRLLVKEVLSDVELTQYQTLALQCIIDDLAELLSKQENH